MSYVITQGCVDITDKACMDVCPVECISEGARMLYINPVECIDCGACEVACPQNAIVMDYGSADLEQFRLINSEFFEGQLYGPVEGSNRTELSDHPAVAILPPGPA